MQVSGGEQGNSHLLGGDGGGAGNQQKKAD